MIQPTSNFGSLLNDSDEWAANVTQSNYTDGRKCMPVSVKFHCIRLFHILRLRIYLHVPRPILFPPGKPRK